MKDLLVVFEVVFVVTVEAPFGHPLAEPMQEPRPGYLEGVRDDALGAVWRKGETLLKGIREAIAKTDIGARLSGIPPIFFITFEKDEDKLYKSRRTELFTQLIRRHVFMQPYHHGYVCYRHTDDDIAAAVAAVEESLAVVQKSVG